VKLEWDLSKEAANRIKHGIDFSTVPEAFEDSQRIFIRYPGLTETKPVGSWWDLMDTEF